MHLDYSLKTPEERLEYINKLLSENPSESFSNQYLTYMSDYLLFVADKHQTKKEKKEEHAVLTKNREITINKRQVSYEELVSNLESGEDGLYAMIRNDKNQILDHRDRISERDIEEIPGLRENMDTIAALQKQFEKAEGRDRYLFKKQIISKYQEQYILKASYRGIPSKSKGSSTQIKNMAHMSLNENITFDKDGFPVSDGIISLFNPAHVSFLLCYYAILKQECAEDLNSDMYYLLLDLEDLVYKVFFKDEPVLFDLIVWKIDGKTNEEIQQLMDSKYGVRHNEQYFSTLWRKRIPKMIVDQAQKDYLLWYYTNEEYGNWKKCGRCGEVKLAHPLFFSKNTSKDGYYSICKDCRSRK